MGKMKLLRENLSSFKYCDLTIEYIDVNSFILRRIKKWILTIM